MASGHVNRAQRPNTWLHRPSLRREDSSCQLGAVHTWPVSTILTCRWFERFRVIVLQNTAAFFRWADLRIAQLVAFSAESVLRYHRPTRLADPATPYRRLRPMEAGGRGT